MDHNKKSHLYVTMMLTFLSFGVSYAINFILTAYLTNTVGVEMTGHVSLAKNFVSYATIITTAVNAFAVRYITIAYHKGDKDYMNRCYSTVFFADLILGGALLLIASVIVLNLQSVIQVSELYVNSVKLLFAFVFSSFFISTCGTVFAAASYVKNRLDLHYAIQVAAHAVDGILLLVLFKYCPANVWYVGLGLVISSMIILVGNLVLTKKMLPDLRPKASLFSPDILKTVVGKGLWNALNSLGNTLNSGLDLYISNVLLSETAAGQVSIAKTMGGLTSTLYMVASSPFQPAMLKLYSAGDHKGLLAKLKQSQKFCGWLTNIFLAGFFALGMSFYRLWIPGEDIKLIYTITLITLAVAVTESSVYPLYYIYTLTLKNKYPCFVTIAGGVLNVGSMILLINFTDLGIYAIVITTAVIMTVINLISNPLYMCHCLKIKPMTFYPQIVRSMLSLVIAGVTMYGIVSFLPAVNSWLSFLLSAALCGLAGAVIQIPVMFTEDGIKLLKKKLRRS